MTSDWIWNKICTFLFGQHNTTSSGPCSLHPPSPPRFMYALCSRLYWSTHCSLNILTSYLSQGPWLCSALSTQRSSLASSWFLQFRFQVSAQMTAPLETSPGQLTAKGTHTTLAHYFSALSSTLAIFLLFVCLFIICHFTLEFSQLQGRHLSCLTVLSMPIS